MAWPTVAIDTTSMDAGTDSPATARAQLKQIADNVNAIKDAKDAAGGIAGLDNSGKLKPEQAPTWGADKGGTGFSSYTVGDIFYANSTNTLAKLPAGSAGLVLKSNGAGNAPSWQMEGGGLTSGTRMSFNQTTAPTGWTKDTTAALNDSLMRIVTGTVGNGGSQAFSTFNGLTATGATTLSSSLIPVMPIEIYESYNTGGAAGSNFSGPTPKLRGAFEKATSSTTGWHSTSTSAADGAARIPGGGGSHSHPLSLNLKYYDFIIAQKD